jgi:dUTP pyrophosphatase
MRSQGDGYNELDALDEKFDDIFNDIFGRLVPDTRPKIPVKLLVETATLPTYGSDGASCADLRSAEGITIWPHSTTIVKTGLAMAIPEGWGGWIRTRSGMATKGLTVRGGVIDSDYRGEVGVILHNSTGEMINIFIGDRIAQIDFRPVEKVNFVQVESLSETERGQGGFGSTGTR